MALQSNLRCISNRESGTLRFAVKFAVGVRRLP
jgi:hypothetical protein